MASYFIETTGEDLLADVEYAYSMWRVLCAKEDEDNAEPLDARDYRDRNYPI